MAEIRAFQNYRNRQRVNNAIRIVIVILFLCPFALVGVWAINEDAEIPRAPKPTRDSKYVDLSNPDAVAMWNEPDTEESSASADVGTGGSQAAAVNGPNYKKTIQALEAEQSSITSQMVKATADARYYELMLIKSETERKIADNQAAQEVAHT